MRPRSAHRSRFSGRCRIIATPREKEVLDLLARGSTNRQIAAELFISEKTAGVHVSNILPKLGASNRGDPVARAIREGLVDLTDHRK